MLELFATPVLLREVPDFARLNAILQPRILARQQAHPGLEHSNVNGWHSDTAMLDWGGAEARALARWIGDLALLYTRDPASAEAPRFRWGARMWANVSTRGAANAAHAHPGALWSAVYYVDDGGADGDPGAGGELVLMDPRYPLVQQAAPDLQLLLSGGAPMRAEQPIRPRAGMVVLFPSWLMHFVRPYRGEGVRISVAVNLSVVPLAAGG